MRVRAFCNVLAIWVAVAAIIAYGIYLDISLLGGIFEGWGPNVNTPNGMPYEISVIIMGVMQAIFGMILMSWWDLKGRHTWKRQYNNQLALFKRIESNKTCGTCKYCSKCKREEVKEDVCTWDSE